MVHNAYAELVLLLVAAALAGLIALRLRLPLLLGYILVGVLAGPVGFGWLGAREDIQLFAQIGLTLLLFVVGLRLDLHIIRTLGRTALIAGAGQILITGVLGYLLALALGIPPAATPLVALGLALSSTIVAVKLLSDRHEIDALHGRLALGILIIQDLAAVMALFILSTGATPLDGHAAASGWVVLLRGVGLLVGAWLAAFYVLPRLLRFIAQSTELLVIAAIAWALLVAYLSELAGFGQEVGAFIAGVTLASTPYREVLGAKLASVRDFLLLFFFVQLGATLTFAAPGRQLFIAVPLILFTLTVKPAAIMAILGAMGYRPRTSFLAGITLAQVSEFSLILLAQATLVGLVPRDIASALTLVALVTIAVSSVMVANGRSIYQVLAPRLHRFAPLMRRQHDEAPPEHLDIILFGLGAYGTGIAQHLREADRVVLGIDFDPQVVEGWRRRGWPALFGDAEDVDYVCALPLERARWVVSTIRDPGINRALALALRQARYAGNLAFTTRERGLGMPLLEEHPGLLLVPSEDAAVQAVDMMLAREDEIARETMRELIDAMHDHYIICGYGRMGQQIASDLRQESVPFVVVEDNPEQIPRLKAENIPHVIGNASGDDTLQQAGIMRAKGLVAVTATDEENVFIVLTARGMNPGLYIVARSIREENEGKLRRAGANRVMSPYILGGRRMSAAIIKPGVMDFLDLLVHRDGIETDVVCLPVPPASPAVGRTLEHLGLWQACGVTVLAVQHDTEVLANPCPDYVVAEGDSLIMMGTPDQLAGAERFLRHV